MNDQIKKVLWGLVFIILAALLTLDAFEIWHFNIFFKGWWTFFIMIPCFIGILTDHRKRDYIIGFLVGLALFIGYQEIIDSKILGKLVLPAILLIVGISIIWPAKSKKKIINLKINNKKYINSDSKYTTVFSSREVDFSNNEFHGADFDVVFGNINIDLENALINQDVVLDCNVVFASLTIRLPKNVNIVIEPDIVFGRIKDKRSQNVEINNYEHSLYINGDCAFGSIILL